MTHTYKCCTCGVHRVREEFGTINRHGLPTRTAKCLRCLATQKASSAKKAAT